MSAQRRGSGAPAIREPCPELVEGKGASGTDFVPGSSGHFADIAFHFKHPN